MCEGLQVIRKAKKRTSGSLSEWESQHDIADERVALLRVDFTDAIEEMQNEINEASLKTAIATGRTAQVAKEVKWKKELFEDMDANIKGAVDDSATSSKRFMPSIARDVVYDKKAKTASAWVNEYSKQRLGQMDKQTRKVVKDVLKEKRSKNLSPAKTAKLLRDRIGLNSVQAQAMTNLENGMIDKGKTEKQIAKAKEQYRKRAIKYRAKMIANTEAIDAVNFGQLELWNQAVDQKLIDPNTTYKQWFVTPDDKLCPYCRGMDGQKKKLDQMFVDPSGTFEPVYSPTLHPNCRCSMILKIT